MPENEETTEQVETEPQVTAPAPEAEQAQTDPWADPVKARREIEKLRKESAGWRTKYQETKPLAQKAQELEDAKKSEQERLTEQLTSAEQRIQQLRQRAVRSEVKALAASEFADPEDAHAFLDLTSYVDDDGDVDTAAIQQDLKELLKRKPHLAKPTDTSPRAPKADRTQGSSGNGNRTPNDPAAVFADFMNQGLARGH
ncbi:hypothetical protein [Streptomyces coeruleorubidus]|uniref:hypothetical protein n=1 Tax=Streptomyces coeruleorubidus TaxID=116188 RepID=UPI0033B868BD